MKKIVLGILCILGNNSFGQTKAKYYFNGNANDVGDDKIHGNVSNCKLVKDRWGLDSSAYEFNGKNSYIKISDPNQKLGHYVGQYTVSFWFKPYQILSSKDMTLVDRGDNTGYNYCVNVVNKKIYSQVNTTGSGNYGIKELKGTTILQPNIWYFIEIKLFDGCTKTGDCVCTIFEEKLSLQLNCNIEASYSNGISIHHNSPQFYGVDNKNNNIFIGISKNLDKPFYGIIDDIQFNTNDGDCKDKPTSKDSLIINKTVYKYDCVNTTYDTVKVYAPIFYNDTTRITVYDTVLTPYYYDVPVCRKTVYDTITTYDTVRINQLVKNQDTMFIKWKTGSGIEATAGTGMLSTKDIKVFPNPTMSNITIDCSGMNVNTYVNKVYLRDMSGWIHRSYEGHFYTLDNYKRIEINMSDLVSKVYVLEVIDNFGNKITIPIVKQ
jgi:hypothetical protein